MKQQRQDVFRQGDVALRQTTRTPSADATRVTDQGRVILAYGEVTGHAHEVLPADQKVELPFAQFFEEPDGTRVLVVDRPCMLVHQEHGPIALAPGTYRVTRQREYQPQGIVNVAD